MKNTKRYFLISQFWAIIIFAQYSESQSIYLDPSLILLQETAQNTIYETIEPVLLGISIENWSVSCTAEPLVNEAAQSEIQTSQLYIKHDLSEDYIPINTSIDLGSGTAPTSPYNAIINKLSFRVVLQGSELAGEYHSLIHFYNFGVEAAQLTIMMTIQPSLEFTIEPATIEFSTSSPAVYSGNDKTQLSITSSNTTDWHIQALLNYSNDLKSFSNSNIFIKSDLSEYANDDGAGVGFQSLEQNPLLMSGDQVGLNGSTEVEIRILTDWSTRTGIYYVTIEFQIPQIGISQLLNFTIEVAEYSTFSISQSSIYFHANGPPDLWDGNQSAKLNVGTNCGSWSVNCEATSLKSENDEIPNERLFIKLAPDDFSGDEGGGIGYRKMDVTIQVAEGTPLPPQDVSEMWFRLQTMDIDYPGHYEGTITFTYLTNP